MNHFDPGRVRISNNRSSTEPEAASHFHPLIGLYDSGDPDVLGYQSLLMKVTGIDGAIIDWYGADDYHDYAFIHKSAQKFAAQLTKVGLEFAICLEDRTIPELIAGKIIEPEGAIQHWQETFYPSRTSRTSSRKCSARNSDRHRE